MGISTGPWYEGNMTIVKTLDPIMAVVAYGGALHLCQPLTHVHEGGMS